MVLGEESAKISLHLDFTGGYQDPYGYVVSPKNEFSSKKSTSTFRNRSPRDYLHKIVWKDHKKPYFQRMEISYEPYWIFHKKASGHTGRPIFLDSIEIDFNSTKSY